MSPPDLHFHAVHIPDEWSDFVSCSATSGSIIISLSINA